MIPTWRRIPDLLITHLSGKKDTIKVKNIPTSENIDKSIYLFIEDIIHSIAIFFTLREVAQLCLVSKQASLFGYDLKIWEIVSPYFCRENNLQIAPTKRAVSEIYAKTFLTCFKPLFKKQKKIYQDHYSPIKAAHEVRKQIKLVKTWKYCDLHLNLKNCKLKFLPWELTTLSSQVTWLDLSSNSLCKVPEVLGSFSKLNLLKLNENPLIEFKLSNNVSLFSLRTLALRSVGLTHWPMDIQYLPSLGILDLGYNQIQRIDQDSISNSNLTVLNLQNNQIHFAYFNAYFSQIEEINLSSNFLREFPEFFNKTKITIIDVSLNQITYLPVDLINYISLSDLIIRETNIHEFPPSYLQELNYQLSKVRKNISLDETFSQEFLEIILKERILVWSLNEAGLL